MNTEERYISLLTDFGFKRIFGTKPNKLFEEAEIAKFNAADRREYEDSLKAYRDIKNSIDTALEQGREEGMKKGRAEGLEKGLKKGLKKGRAEGRAKGRMDMVRAMLQRGLDIQMIAELSGLTAEEIRSLT